MGATRKDLRRAVGDKTGEVLVLTATTAGTTSTFTDVVRLLDREDNAVSLVNRLGLFSGGTVENLGHECRVTAFAKTTRTLTFAPESPAAVMAGDELEVWSNWARFGGVSALHRFINEAIASVADFTGEQVYDAAQAFVASAPELAIPVGWNEFSGVDREDRNGRWHEIPPKQLRVRKGLRTVELLHPACRLAHLHNVRLWGYAPAPALVNDTSETNVDREWLVETVSSAMRLGLSWRSSDRAAEERLANFWKGVSVELRRKLGGSRPGMGISLS